MGKRILVIDDDEAVRESFRLALEDTSYTVEAAASGEEGLLMATRKQYDLIVLDLKMPGMNGVQTMLQLRRGGIVTPVYILTAFFEEFFEELRDARQEGIDFELLRKPLGIQEILDVSEGILPDV